MNHLPAPPNYDSVDPSIILAYDRLDYIYSPCFNLIARASFTEHQVRVHVAKIIDEAFPIIEALNLNNGRIDLGPSFTSWLKKITELFVQVVDRLGDGVEDLRQEYVHFLDSFYHF